jgi:Sulfotransferase family
MALSDIPNDRVILILGAPRSGTSWLAKIFDSHPDVLYRHEPDTVLRSPETLPWMCAPDDIPTHQHAAETYLRQLIDTATLKSAGSLPIFPKHHRGIMATRIRSGIIYGLRAIELVRVTQPWARWVRIPDVLDLARLPDVRVVLKSVSSRGRAGLFAHALSGARIILIVRDPFGQIASMLRGEALGMFEDELPVAEVLMTEEARHYGLTPERFASLSLVERLAWNWAVLNEKAINDLAGIPTARVLRYQDLGANPEQEARALLAFCGLDWNPQTEAFVRYSTTHSGRDRYYQVMKDTPEAMNRWRKELSLDDQHRILAVVRQTSLASYCPATDP